MTHEWRLDRPAPGLVVAQPHGGFKYTSDAFWLAGFALEAGAPRTAIDLGTGSGIVARLLAAAGLSVTGVDAHPSWAEGWARSSGPPVAFVTASVRSLPPLAPVDLVTCNPPYWPAGAGPAPRDDLLRAGRVEGEATLRDFVEAGLGLLAPGGTLAMVLPAARVRDLSWGPILAVVTVGDRALVRFGAGPRAPDVAADEARERGWYARFGAPPPTRIALGG